MWQEVVHMLQNEYELRQHKSANIPIFKRLEDLAITLLDFFEAGGNGLTRKQMQTQAYKVQEHIYNLYLKYYHSGLGKCNCYKIV